ncbi:MAG: bacterial Ig-like domain-containing protein [Eubacteriales bacterium]
MKFQSIHKRKKLIVLIVVGVLFLACIIGVIIFQLVSEERQKQEELAVTYGIAIANKPNKMVYLVGERFEPEGLTVQLITNKAGAAQFVDYTKLTFTGFDSSVPNDSVAVTVSYGEFATILVVKVEADPTADPGSDSNPESQESTIEIRDMILTYTMSRWNSRGPSTYGAYALITKPDGTEYGSLTETALSNDMIRNYEKVSEPCEYELIILYIEKDGTEHRATVTVTITE